MGIFVNDRAWNIQQAKKNYEWAEWHMKRAADASRRNDTKAARDHLYSAKLYKAKGDEYIKKRCTHEKMS